MYTLGIETSCDETSCAVVKGREVMSNVTLSSIREHRPYGGVVPEIATRAHLRSIDLVASRALERAKIKISKIGLVTATECPGLFGALVVGVNFAKALALGLGKPFLGVNHLHAHLFSSFLGKGKILRFPFVGLVVSGGHTEVYKVEDFNRLKLIGQTRDDACGEAFDKIARAYGLGYPGGPLIDALFDLSLKRSFHFRCGRKDLDLSYSGLKTAVIYKRQELQKQNRLDVSSQKKILSSFQFTALEALVDVSREALRRQGIKHLVCGGGVLANRYLRSRLTVLKSEGIAVDLPEKRYTGDNAAMVAGLGFYLYNRKGLRSSYGCNSG